MARKRRNIFVEGKYYVAEYPHDPTVGWENSRRGIRRRLGTLLEFEHLNDQQTHDELMRRWRETERLVRSEQIDDFYAKAKQQRDKRVMPIRAVVKEWEKHLEITNRAHTKTEYLRSLKVYIHAVGNHPIAQFETGFHTDFRKHLAQLKKTTGEPVSLATQQKHVRHVNAFYVWALEHEYLSKQVKFKAIKVPRKDMQSLDIEQLDLALSYVAKLCAESTKPALYDRYKGLERAMMMARHTILRSGAIWSLKLENIDLANRTIKITGVPELQWVPKAMKFPIKPINDELFAYLKADLEQRNPGEIWYLDDGQGNQWRKQLGNLSREGAKLFKDLGFPQMKPFHEGFRSTLITHMLLRGVPITTVQQLADHSSIQTTQSYLDTRRIQQEQAVAALAALQS